MTKTMKSILCLSLAAMAAWTMPAAAAKLTLKFYDARGAALTFKEAQALQEGTMPGAFAGDALIDPATLRVLSARPMTKAGGFTFRLPRRAPAAFAINWPTSSQGYGLVIVDNGGAGFSNKATVNFTWQAAKDTRRRLDAALAARPDYKRSEAFDAAWQAAGERLNAGEQSRDESFKGAQGQLALEQLVVAWDVLLREYGPAYARAHEPAAAPWLGVTLENVFHYQEDLDRLAGMANPFAWARIVLRPGSRRPWAYAEAVNYAKSKGVKVLGLPVDSSADRHLTRAQYLQCYKDYIEALPGVDCWEVGNEINGGWSSPDIAKRVADAAAYCKSQNKKTYLTLFWQLNTADPPFALFNWIDANLPGSVRSNLDYIGISQYQELAPVGAAFDQVMRRMREEFPSQQIGLGELGYWIRGQRYWWAYSSDPATAKESIVEQYYKASLGYAGANGGCFWWNFSSSDADCDFDATMSNSIAALRDELGGGAVNGEGR